MSGALHPVEFLDPNGAGAHDVAVFELAEVVGGTVRVECAVFILGGTDCR